MRKSILASLVLLPSLALASGYSLPNVNPRDLGLCASGGAAQVDAAATFATPAALARLSGPSVRLGLGNVSVPETWTDPTGIAPDASTKSQFVALPTAYLSFSGKIPALGNRGWGVGAGLVPFGGGIVSWPGDWTGRYRIVKVDRRVLDTMVTAGIEVLPQVRIGGGFIYTYTTESFTQNIYQGFIGAPDVTGKLKLSGGAPSFDLSLEVDPIKSVPLRVSVDYKHKATQKLDGDVTFENVPAIYAGTVPPPLLPFQVLFATNKAKETLTIPNRLNVSAAYQVIKPLLVTAAWTLDRWVVYDQDVFVATNTPATIVVPRHYRNGYTFRGGAEYDVVKELQLRVGVQRDVSGLRTTYYSPTLPDASSWAGSVGATYRFPRGVSLDAGVFYAKMDKVTSTPPPGSADPPTAPATVGTFRGEYDIHAWIYGISLGWTPGRT